MRSTEQVPWALTGNHLSDNEFARFGFEFSVDNGERVIAGHGQDSPIKISFSIDDTCHQVCEGRGLGM